jgi:threonine aldolase
LSIPVRLPDRGKRTDKPAMSERWIDLRSDTATRPTLGMRRAMAEAEVGDDVFGEDPTVNRLEERVADLVGLPAAVFVASGTMANQIAVRVHTRPGDELLCEQNAHVCSYEAGGPAMLSGVSCRTAPGRRGILDVEDLQGLVRPENLHFPRTRLVTLENTHNRGGGSVYPLGNVERICAWARGQGFATHLDGARLLNAAVASGIPARRWCQGFDTVSLCFSKGLGAPVGSVLCGSEALIKEARRVRKVFGGAMRQAGILAAACIYALDHNVDRLAEDHANARLLAEAIAATSSLRIHVEDVETNLVWFEVDPSWGPAQRLVDQLRSHRILAAALGGQRMRLCTHLDVSRADVEYAAQMIGSIARSPAA